MQIIYKPTTTKDEGCKVDTNKGYTILRWNTKKELVVLVEAKTPTGQHLTSIMTGTIKKQGD